MNNCQHSTAPNDAASAAAQAFHDASDMENPLTAAADVLRAIGLICLSEDFGADDKDAAATMRLCGYGLREIEAAEKLRVNVFHQTHRFAYPNAVKSS